MGRGKRRLLFPLPIEPRALSFSPLPSLSTTQGGLLRRIVSKLLLWKYSLPFLEMADEKEASSAASYPEVSCL